MALRLTILLLLGPAVMHGWGSAGAPEWGRHQRIRNFWRLMGKGPDSPEAARAAALRAAAVGDAALCRQLLVEGAAQFPEQAGLFHFELGGAMSRLGRPDAAIAAFRRAVDLRKGLRVSFGYLALAALLERRGRAEEAWRVHQELIADPDSPAIHVVDSAAFALRHGRAEARKIFELALEKAEKEGLTGPGQEPAAADFQRAAVVAADLNLPDRCEALFREATAKRPESEGWLQYEFAVVLERLGRLDEALALYRSAKQNPSGLKVSFACLSLAKLLEKTGQTGEAKAIFDELAASREVLVPHLAEAGAFEARQGRVEQGLARFLEAFRRAAAEDEQVAVGNVLSEEIQPLPPLNDLARWFRSRSEALPAGEKQKVRRALATAFGNHAWKLLSERAFADAGTAAEMALVIFAPDVLKWVEGNRAHAYLFQGRFPEARAIHERYQAVQLELDGLDWKKAAREDFAAFRQMRLVTPEVEQRMRAIEDLLGIGLPQHGGDTRSATKNR